MSEAVKINSEICPKCYNHKFTLASGSIFYYLTCEKCYFTKVFRKSENLIKNT